MGSTGELRPLSASQHPGAYPSDAIDVAHHGATMSARSLRLEAISPIAILPMVLQPRSNIMKQFQPSSLKRRDAPSHVADAGKIVLGAGVRMPALNVSIQGQRQARQGSDLRPVAKCKAT